jgi:hypothetical protein
MISAQMPLSTSSSSERLDRVASEHMVQVKQQRAASLRPHLSIIQETCRYRRGGCEA